MLFFNIAWFLLNLTLILLILIRSPDEQSLQETLGPLNFFDSSGSAEKKIDKIIRLLVVLYFLIGFLLASKAS